MTESLVIVGCGGHGREALSIVRAHNQAVPGDRAWEVLGFVDDHPSDAHRQLVGSLGVPLLGSLEWLADAPRNTHVILGLGEPATRRAIGRRIDGYGLPSASVVHPAATVGPDLRAGPGLLVFAGARITVNVTLGRHVHINQNATVGHDCTFDDYVSVHPLAAVSGNCRLESGVMIGTTAAVLQGRRIGAGATVGAGACVVHDIPAAATVKGIPAR